MWTRHHVFAHRPRLQRTQIKFEQRARLAPLVAEPTDLLAGVVASPPASLHFVPLGIDAFRYGISKFLHEICYRDRSSIQGLFQRPARKTYGDKQPMRLDKNFEISHTESETLDWVHLKPIKQSTCHDSLDKLVFANDAITIFIFHFAH